MNSVTRYMSIFIMAVTLQACGGGGGGSSYEVDDGPDNPPPDQPTDPADATETDAKLQVITATSEASGVSTGASVGITLAYHTEPEPVELAGLGLRIHWNSAMLDYVELQEVYAAGLLGVSDPQLDSQDFDSDTDSDYFVVVSWADFPAGKWPTTSSWPIDLGQVRFSALAVGATTVNFSASALAMGHQLSADNISIAVE